MKYPKIVKAEYIKDYTIKVTFSDGVIGLCDLSVFVDMFELLKNKEFFKCFKVDVGGYGLVWNDDLDVAESYLYTILKKI